MAKYTENQININETERINAEQQRINNETQRQTKEKEREARETTRQSNESTRISKEAERLAEEVNRQEAETSRVTAEQGRVEAENIRAEFYEGFNDKLDVVNTQLTHKVNVDNIVYINVSDFGVIGDGVTDVTDKLQELFNTYSNIYLPEGNYIVTKPIEIKQIIKINSHPKAILKPTVCDDVMRIIAGFCDINVNIDGSLQPTSNKEKAGIVVGYNGGNSLHTKLHSTRISNMKTNGIIWEHGSMCDFSLVRLYRCEYDGIVCTDNYNDNNHGLFQNTHIIECATGLKIQGDYRESQVLPSRHHVFNNLKIFGCNKNIHIETINNVGTIFLEEGKEASELTNTSFGNKISIIETVAEFSRFLDNGSGNVVEGYSNHNSWVMKKSTVFKHTVGDTANTGLNNTYQDKNNSFINDFSLTSESVVYNYAKGSASKRTDYFQDRVKFAGGMVINLAKSGEYIIPDDTTINPGEVKQFVIPVSEAGKGDTLLCTLSGGDGYTYLVSGSISESGSCYCTIYNPGDYTKSIANFKIRYILMKHFA